MKYVLIFFLSLIKLLYCQVEITLPYSKNEEMEANSLHYKLTIPMKAEALLITTIPTDPSNQIIFYVNEKTANPTYSTSSFKADSAGKNELLVKLSPGNKDKVWFFSVYSTKSKGQFEINCKQLDQPFIEVGQEFVAFSNKLSTLFFKPLDKTSKVFFYAIGGNLEDFYMLLALKNGNEVVKSFAPRKLFRTGYGLEIDLATIEGLDIDLHKFDVTVPSSQKDNKKIADIKVGLMTFTPERTLELLKENIGYLQGANKRVCYSFTIVSDKTLILHLNAYPSPVNIIIVNSEGDEVKQSPNAIDTLRLSLTPKLQKICLELANPTPADSELVTYSFQAYDLAEMEALQQFLLPVKNGISTKYYFPSGKAIGFRRRRFNSWSSTPIEMHMYAVEGNPILHTHKCTAYPCQYTRSIIEDEQTKANYPKAT